MQVDPLHQWSGNACAIPLNGVRAASTSPRGVAGPATGAGIHRRDQLEACREIAMACRPRNADGARFQGFAQHLKGMPTPFRQFVEEQHAEVGERDLARARIGTAVICCIKCDNAYVATMLCATRCYKSCNMYTYNRCDTALINRNRRDDAYNGPTNTQDQANATKRIRRLHVPRRDCDRVRVHA